VRSIDEENFHLLLLDHMLRAGRASAADLEAFVRAGVDLEGLRRLAVDGGIPGEQAAARAVVARLAEYPVSDADCAAIVLLAADGGDPIYMWIEQLIDVDTGGEEDWYDTVGSPEILRCVNVERVHADCYFSGLDCELLVGLTQMTEVHLGMQWRNPEALLRVPSLRTLTTHGAPLPLALAAELILCGVAVSVR
jgi:hypothetical protein